MYQEGRHQGVPEPPVAIGSGGQQNRDKDRPQRQSRKAVKRIPVDTARRALSRAQLADVLAGYNSKLPKRCRRYSPRVRAGAASAIPKRAGKDFVIGSVNGKVRRFRLLGTLR